jgi:hypothetical protein
MVAVVVANPVLMLRLSSANIQAHSIGATHRSPLVGGAPLQLEKYLG